MTKMILATVLCLLLSVVAFGQERTIVGFVGSEYNSSGSPAATMVLGGMVPVGSRDYAGVAADLAFKPNQQPGVTFRPEYLKYAGSVTIGKVTLPIYAIIGVGVQFQASDPAVVIQQLRAALANVGTNVGYSAAVGATTRFKVWKLPVMAPAFRTVKGSLNDTQYVVGLTFPFEFRASRD
jgi:hypothetical protein